jgi:Acetyltransferase (GNAT) domain
MDMASTWEAGDLARRAFQEYERLIAPARERFALSPGVQAIQTSRDGAFLESFLLHFCALGSRMTEPVEHWISQAAERCASMELPELAVALSGHANAEAGHHLMMLADLAALAARWNARRLPPVHPGELLSRALSPGGVQYRKVHDQNVAGDTPYAQVAIEYEVELLPVRYGELFMTRCVDVLGADILPCLSFVTEHIVLDKAHTTFNARAMVKLLEFVPSCLPALVSAGTAVLDAYGQFLCDCAQLADHDSREAQCTLAACPVSLSWHIRVPLGVACNLRARALPVWLDDVRSLRGAVLFENGRRPCFRTADKRLFDPDPIDLHSHHILAHVGQKLVGCVRFYHLGANSLPCVTEKVLGETVFSDMLNELGVQRTDTVEIGRWIVHPAYRANGRPATQLAAASAALALTLGDGAIAQRGTVICSVGRGNKQDLILARVGLATVPGLESIKSDEFNDDVGVMYCTGERPLNAPFFRIISDMVKRLALCANLPELKECELGVTARS